MTSCTSPRDSAIGLPISRVRSCESASRFSSTRRPSCWIARPRTGAGTAAHPGCAARAARHASTNVPASPSSASATVCGQVRGVRDGETAARSLALRPPPDDRSHGSRHGPMLPRLAIRVFGRSHFRVPGPGADDVNGGGGPDGRSGIRPAADLGGAALARCVLRAGRRARRRRPRWVRRHGRRRHLPPERPREPSASGTLAPAARGTTGCPERCERRSRLVRDVVRTPRLHRAPAGLRVVERERHGDGRGSRREGPGGLARGPRPVEADVARPRRGGAAARARRFARA